jgi:hypothetical protein
MTPINWTRAIGEKGRVMMRKQHHYFGEIYMARIYKRHGSLFKAKVALEALKEKKKVAELCQEYSVASSQIFAWKKQLEESCEMQSHFTNIFYAVMLSLIFPVFIFR